MTRGAGFLQAALLMIAASIGCGGAANAPPPGRRLVVLAVDGATWSVLSPMLEKGDLPTLARLYRGGSAGLLRASGPLSPATVWTTVATGRPPAVHAIGWEAERTPGRYSLRPLTADRRGAPAIWTIAGAAGLTVGVSGWPVTFPAESVRGYLIADLHAAGSEEARGTMHPPGALGEEEPPAPRPAFASSAAALDPGLASALDADLAALSRGLDLYRVYQPRVALFRLTSIDYASHRFWQYYEPRYLDLAASRGEAIDPDRARRLAEAIPSTYRFLDACVGMLLERVPESATLLILSDHGFRGVTVIDALHVDMNPLLRRLGYLTVDAEGRPDWESTRVFTLQDTLRDPRGLHLNVRGREERGIVEPAAAPALRDEVVGALRSLRTDLGEPLFASVSVRPDPEPGEPEIEVVENRDLEPAGRLRVGGETLLVTDLYRRYADEYGVHDPVGMILAVGDGIATGRTGWEAGLLDVLPTMLVLLGLPLAGDLPGHPIEPMLDPPMTEDHPRVKSYDDLPAGPGPVLRPLDRLDEDLRRLRESGHLR